MHHFPHALFCLYAAGTLLVSPSAYAQPATRIVVGVTPTCPYGIQGCAGAAVEALRKLDGVESVTVIPDAYNCTFELELKTAELPRLARWREQFKAVVGEVFIFRGVEVTVSGRVQRAGDQFELQIPGLAEPIRIAPLENKLQWNFRKRAARQPEPDEREACRQLTVAAAETNALQVQITGPLRDDERGPILEVREYYSRAK